MDNQDRDDFLKRLGNIVTESGTLCYAWSLLPNHFHLLLKTGNVPVATVMRRLLTGYVIRFNGRHGRSGHLFQNRYKSILCQEDAYLKELIRYIHLNPVRAGLAKDLTELDAYGYAGHSAIMGKLKRDWQAVDSVLSLFDDKVSTAPRAYRTYVEGGMDQGSRWDLIGGGLVRSAGGWSAVRSLGKERIFFKSDERLLGDSKFVEKVLSEADEAMERKYAVASQGVDLGQLIASVTRHLSIQPDRIVGPGKSRDVVLARSLICYWGSTELGLTMTRLAATLGISVPAASVAAKRGRRIAADNGYSFSELLNINI